MCITRPVKIVSSLQIKTSVTPHTTFAPLSPQSRLHGERHRELDTNATVWSAVGARPDMKIPLGKTTTCSVAALTQMSYILFLHSFFCFTYCSDRAFFFATFCVPLDLCIDRCTSGAGEVIPSDFILICLIRLTVAGFCTWKETLIE